MVTLKYDLRTAYESGVTEHPQKEMKKLGYEVLAFEGVPIADAVFMEVVEVIEPLPKYLEVSKFEITVR